MKNPKLNFSKKDGLIPAIIQDEKSGLIYMLGYMNEKALSTSIITGWVCFWSRTRNKLWMKGETSGNKLKIINILTDCAKNSLLIKVELVGKIVCHTGSISCYYQKF